MSDPVPDRIESRLDVDRYDLYLSIRSVVILSLLLIASISVVSIIGEIPTQGREYPIQTYYTNSLEHFIGMFCIASAFLFQFGSRLDNKYIPQTQPPWFVPMALYGLGTSFSLFSVGMFTTRQVALLFDQLGDLLLAFMLLPTVAYLMAVYASPKDRG